MLLIIFLYMFLSRRNRLRAQKNQLPETPTDSDNKTSYVPELMVSPKQESDELVSPQQHTKVQSLGPKRLNALQTRDSRELYT